MSFPSCGEQRGGSASESIRVAKPRVWRGLNRRTPDIRFRSAALTSRSDSTRCVPAHRNWRVLPGCCDEGQRVSPDCPQKVETRPGTSACHPESNASREPDNLRDTQPRARIASNDNRFPESSRYRNTPKRWTALSRVSRRDAIAPVLQGDDPRPWCSQDMAMPDAVRSPDAMLP